MTTTRVAINGFGRIGRQVIKAIHERYWDSLEVVAVGVTDPFITEHRALLLQHDSVYGRFAGDVRAVIEGRTNGISVDGRLIEIVGRNPYGPVPEWKRWDVDLLLEATGYCKDRTAAQKHLLGGARRVVITAPAKKVDLTVVVGVNEAKLEPERHVVVSNASCTTNCLAPAAKVLQEGYGIRQGLLSTIHSYTSSQVLLDHAGKDPRRSRAAGLNIVPTTTGAAKAVGEVIPELAGRFHGSALRVPTPTVSLADFTALVERRPANAAEVNEVLRAAAAGPMAGVLGLVDVPLVSVDFTGDPHSSIVDAPATMVQGDLVKTVLWYDNEWGYSCRVADLAFYFTQRVKGRGHEDVRAEMRARLPQGILAEEVTA
jgi:glyceraldehyde 3-phosphate dehydrogenase